MNTVEGVFRILDRASPALDRIERKASALDRTLERTGARMDDFSAKTERDMKVAESGVDSFGRATERTSGKVSASMELMERSVATSTSAVQRDLAETQTQLLALDAQQANPSIDIDTTGALAQIALVRSELRSLGNEKINIGTGRSGLASAAAASAVGQPKQGMFKKIWQWGKATATDAAVRRAERGIQGKVNNVITRLFTRGPKEVDETTEAVDKLTKKVAKTGGVFGTVGERIWSWTKILFAAGPALESVTAAASALIGTLGSATLGAGVGLTGIIGTAITGFAGFAGSLIPVVSKLKESEKALYSYTKAIRTYGRESKEAEKAKHIFERTGTKETRQILGVWGATKRFWRKATRPGQEEVTGLVKDLMQTGRRRFLPQFAGISNQSAEAVREGGNAFMNELDSPNLHRNLNILSNTFQDISPSAGNTLANAARLVTNLAAAARPEVIEFFRWFDKWMRGAQRDTTNLDKLDAKFKDWTKDFKLWTVFFKQLGLLAITFFGAGKGRGRNLVMEATDAMREQREEWQKDPSGLHSWFDKQTDNFKKLAREIGALVKALGELVDMLSETIGPITEVSQAVRQGLGGGVIGTIGSVATLAGGAMAIRGIGRGIGRAGAGALGRRLPGRLGEYFLEKAGQQSATSTAAEIGGSAATGVAGGAAASRGAGLLSRFGPGVARFGGAALGGYVLAELGLKGLGKLGVGDPTEGQGIFTSLTHGFKTDGADEVMTKHEEYLYELGMSPRAIDKLNPERGKLFNIYGRKYGDVKAFNKALDPTTEALKKAGPKGVEIIGTNALMWANAQRRQNPKLEDAYEELVTRIKHRYSQLGQHIAIVNSEIFTGSQQEWGNIRKAMSSNVEQALEEVTRGFTAIQRQAIGSLMGMGFSHQQATKLVRESEKGGETGRIARANMNTGPVLGGNAFTSPSERKAMGPHGGHRAAGGIIPGMGMQDSVHFGPHRVAPGEAYIATRHQRAEIDAMLPPGVTTLGIISGNRRWHSAPMKRPHQSFGHRRAGGGMISVGRYASGLGLNVSGGPGFGGIPTSGHVADSLHYAGLAYDVSGAPSLMWKFRRLAEQRYLGHGLNELFYDPYAYYIDQGHKVPGSLGGHSDHVHIGFFPGGPTGASRIQGLMGAAGRAAKFHPLQAPRSRMGGIPGAMAQRGLNAMTTGMNARLRKQIGMQARRGATRGGPIHAVGASRSAVERAIAGELFRHGANKVGAAGIIGNAYAESSMVPTAEGTGGGGLWGFTSGAISLANLKAAGGRNWGNPIFQTQFMLSHGGQGLLPSLNRAGSPEAAARLFMEQWERPGIPRLDVREGGARAAFRQGYQAGGPIDFAGWMKDGGSFTVKRPTLFGAGESGAEDVHVVPRGDGKAVRAGGRRSGPLVHIANVEFKRPGDLRKAIEEEFAALGMRLEHFADDEDEVFS